MGNEGGGNLEGRDTGGMGEGRKEEMGEGNRMISMIIIVVVVAAAAVVVVVVVGVLLLMIIMIINNNYDNT